MLGFLRFTIRQAANSHLNHRNCGYGGYDCRSIRLLALYYKLMFLVGEKGPFVHFCVLVGADSCKQSTIQNWILLNSFDQSSVLSFELVSLLVQVLKLLRL